MTQNPTLKQIIEAALFAAGEPISLERLKDMVPAEDLPADADWEGALDALAADYAGHVLQLQKVSSGYRFQVRASMAPWVAKLWEERPARYTRALLETLALVAYRQPITRGEIEDIRGVSVSTQILKTLQDREWVRVVGHRDVPGRPALYATTKQFLDYFNLQSLEDLPPLSALRDLDQAAEDLNFDAIADAVREEMHSGVGQGASPHLAAIETSTVADAMESESAVQPAANDELLDLPSEGDAVASYLASLVEDPDHEGATPISHLSTQTASSAPLAELTDTATQSMAVERETDALPTPTETASEV